MRLYRIIQFLYRFLIETRNYQPEPHFNFLNGDGLFNVQPNGTEISVQDLQRSVQHVWYFDFLFANLTKAIVSYSP